jgi:hypothetical protein
MLASFALGTIVGCLGALSLAFSVFAVYRALRDGKSYSKEVASILALPAFYGGGTWSRSALIPQEDIQRGAGIYLLMIMITLIAINFFPCLKLIKWLDHNIDLGAKGV